MMLDLQKKLDAMSRQLDRIEAYLIERDELARLGHRIVFDVKTGWSANVPGCQCDPRLLDARGVQVRLQAIEQLGQTGT